MKSCQGSPNETVEKPAASTEKSARFSTLATGRFEQRGLAELALALERGMPLGLQDPLAVEEVAILEAELRNQGVLWGGGAERGFTLAQQAALEVNLWRWRARRLGKRNTVLRFSVDVPRYVIAHAEELRKSAGRTNERLPSYVVESPGVQGINSLDSRELRLRMAYLDQLACYLLGEHRRDDSQFDKGLDLILRILSIPKAASLSAQAITQATHQSETAEPPLAVVELILPLTKRDFLMEAKGWS